jgi:hypothetical protein
MRKIILTESQYKLLHEIDWEDTYSDVYKACVNVNKLIEDLNNQLNKVLIDKEMSDDNEFDGNKKKSDVFQPFYSKESRKRLTKISSSGELGIDIGSYIKAITGIPKTIFDSNSKMEKSSEGGTQMVVNTGLPALLAIVYDKERSEFFKVNTCPKAGECRDYCYARKGQYGMNDGLILKLLQRVNLLLNNPEIYYKMAIRELQLKAYEAQLASTDENPVKLVIRWNDAGDFFAKKYFEIAKDITSELLEKGFDVLSYAYTKDAEIYLGGNKDFVMNFSKGAKKSEQDKVDFENTKYSEVVPKQINLKEPFWTDLFVKPKGKRYDIDEETGLPKFVPNGKEELKQRIAQKYGISANRLMFQNELPKKWGENFQYDAIVYPKGDSDIAAQRWDIQRTFLLIH